MSSFKTEFVALLSSMSASGLFTMKCHSLDHLVEDDWKLRDISVLDLIIYRQFNIHIKRAYRRLSKT